MSHNKVLRVYPLEKKTDEIDKTRAGVSMPVGAEVISVVVMGKDDIGLAAMVDEQAFTRVWHPLIVAPMDLPILPLLGRRVGKPLGLIPIGGAPAAVLEDLPWPQSALEGVEPKGEA